jgi:electron transport complex protein RnfB
MSAVLPSARHDASTTSAAHHEGGMPSAAADGRRHERAWPRPAQAPPARESVRVNESCTACGACLATCPEGALRRAPKRPLVLDSACTACWACIEICPAGAIVAVPGLAGATRPAGHPRGPA